MTGTAFSTLLTLLFVAPGRPLPQPVKNIIMVKAKISILRLYFFIIPPYSLLILLIALYHPFPEDSSNWKSIPESPVWLRYNYNQN